MAVIATDNKEMDAAEEAYAAIGRYDKVDYIRYIKVIIYFYCSYFHQIYLFIVLFRSDFFL